MIKTSRKVDELDTFVCGICEVRYHKSFMSGKLNICKICKRTKGGEELTGRVFVINHIGKDMSDAMRFGTLVPITEGSVNVFNTERVRFDINDFLVRQDFNPSTDYILLSGSTVLNFIAGMITAKFGRVNILIWDAKQQQYIDKEVRL